MKYLVTLLFIFSSILFSQQQVTLTATQDNTLYSEDGTVSNGAGDYIFAGKTASGFIRRALVQFNLTSIPSNATILSAEVTLNMSKSKADVLNVSLHKVLAAWGEGTSNANSNEGSGTTATTNDATWTKRIFNTESWTTPGGDIETTASATTSIGAVGKYTFASTSELVNDVQNWLGTPTANFGWMILGDESKNQTAKRFDSHENSVETNRPQLTVSYSVGTSVSQITETPNQFTLLQNFPNPFNPSTTISYSIVGEQFVSLKVFTLLGQEIASLVHEKQSTGTYSAVFSAKNFPSGVYVYRLQAGTFLKVKTMTLLK